MKLFGTDGIRGIANTQLSPELAFRLGYTATQMLNKKRPQILIGKDTRISSDMLESALASGVCSAGGDVILLGIAPTPAVAYITRTGGFDYGVMISASHNPVEYNGIKFFNSRGLKLLDKEENEIEEKINCKTITNQVIGADIGKIINNTHYISNYCKFLTLIIQNSQPKRNCLFGKRVLLDCANGASCKIASEIFSKLGAQVIVRNFEPNGCNINLNCGSTNIEKLQEYARYANIDVAFAYDGDADRVLALDENGQIVDGDKILCICGLDMKNRNILNKNTIVTTVMSNLGLTEFAKMYGLDIVKTKVGDRYVLESMLENNYVLGGEQSGHIIFSQYSTTGDGILTSLILTDILTRSNKKMSELADIIKVFPQVLINVKVSDYLKDNYMNLPKISLAISETESEILDKDAGKILIRPSGTEPLIRIMIEGKNYRSIKEKAEKLAQFIREIDVNDRTPKEKFVY